MECKYFLKVMTKTYVILKFCSDYIYAKPKSWILHVQDKAISKGQIGKIPSQKLYGNFPILH